MHFVQEQIVLLYLFKFFLFEESLCTCHKFGKCSLCSVSGSQAAKEGGGGMLFGLLVTRTGFRGVYADRLTPSEVVLVVQGIPAPEARLFPENRDILN